jgi:hypothetical protein
MRIGSIILTGVVFMYSLSSFADDTTDLLTEISAHLSRMNANILITQLFVLFIVGVLLHKSFSDGMK